MDTFLWSEKKGLVHYLLTEWELLNLLQQMIEAQDRQSLFRILITLLSTLPIFKTGGCCWSHFEAAICNLKKLVQLTCLLFFSTWFWNYSNCYILHLLTVIYSVLKKKTSSFFKLKHKTIILWWSKLGCLICVHGWQHIWTNTNC